MVSLGLFPATSAADGSPGPSPHSEPGGPVLPALQRPYLRLPAAATVGALLHWLARQLAAAQAELRLEGLRLTCQGQELPGESSLQQVGMRAPWQRMGWGWGAVCSWGGEGQGDSGHPKAVSPLCLARPVTRSCLRRVLQVRDQVWASLQGEQLVYLRYSCPPAPRAEDAAAQLPEQPAAGPGSGGVDGACGGVKDDASAGAASAPDAAAAAAPAAAAPAGGGSEAGAGQGGGDGDQPLTNGGVPGTQQAAASS